MRLLLIWLLLVAWGFAKKPETYPSPTFAVKVPLDWTSPAPDQWCSPEGNISLVWTQVAVAGDLEAWTQSMQQRFPGTVMGQSQKLTVAGGPARSFMGEHQGKIQRVYLMSQGTRGVILICSCSPTQSFAAVGVIQEILGSFRWLPDQGK